MKTITVSNYNAKKLRSFFRLAEIKATFKCAPNFCYEIAYSSEYAEVVSDFFKLDFRKKDAEYQEKMLAQTVSIVPYFIS